MDKKQAANQRKLKNAFRKAARAILRDLSRSDVIVTDGHINVDHEIETVHKDWLGYSEKMPTGRRTLRLELTVFDVKVNAKYRSGVSKLTKEMKMEEVKFQFARGSKVRIKDHGIVGIVTSLTVYENGQRGYYVENASNDRVHGGWYMEERLEQAA